jgi:hypothetical protein
MGKNKPMSEEQARRHAVKIYNATRLKNPSPLQKTNMALAPQAKVIKFSSLKKRDEFYMAWEKSQKKPITSGMAGEYFGDNEVLMMAGKEVTIYPKKGY